ncbi:MAG: T9SS type A sorting domain-containing protein [Saprospiraceae bacterium]|nr:T9SS type A sorting domain-containing protein [Saprospiraceae bacterium]MCF8250416.1 T9SS type A sorting domain-containing protein [Saprospiraceae bacterium]MCF8280664.1 T9SS type A sorting domain-containing protein [Bacteroidales bacterium]MCF8312209.1 T9SS type A sorting domain-containing protein [Saprospiraceae bacterium]MCF8440550.1 T9SS type A sorting domain-containing protein [Saprospiraceae bacterium]
MKKHFSTIIKGLVHKGKERPNGKEYGKRLPIFLAMMLIASIFYAQGNCSDQLAYWNLNACTSGSSYSEFTANTSTPSGFASVSASIFSNQGDHSCNYGQSGEGICHAIRDNCSWSNTDNNAYTFSVTIKPTTGSTAKLSKLTFYESAPSSYSWVGGGSGDNDPPSKYGVRVTKNGTEIFKQIDIATTSAWSLETIDFSADPDFSVTSQTTFNFQILGYCRQGSGGYAVWDVDEIKVIGCSEGPCTNQGGDSDGDGVCNNQDCQPNNAAYPATPGTPCNDNNANTTNDVIQADGCGCAGTPINNNCVIGTKRTVTSTNGNCGTWCTSSYAMTLGAGECYTAGSDVVFKEFTNGTATLTGTFKKGTTTKSVNISFTGKTSIAPSGSPKYDLCINSGGSSWYYYQNFSGTIGSYNITKYGPAFQVGTGANLQENVYGASGWFSYGGNNNGDLNFRLGSASNLITDTDNDGVCDADDCQPNNPALPTTPGTSCNDGNPNTTNDVIQADGCTCAGTPACNLAATFTVPNGCLTSSFLIFADANDPYFPPNNPNYTYSYNIQPANTVAGLSTIDPRSVTATFNAPGVKTVTATITNPAIPNCTLVKTTTFTVSDCSPCANQGGDSDGDGVCNNVDCQPNNPAYPATPGTPCNDGNPNTTNDVVQAGGCSCAGTPANTPDCVNGINISVANNTIVVTGLNGAPISGLQVFSSSWQTIYNCFANCGASQTVVVTPGTYYVYAKYYSAGYQLICEKQATLTVTSSCANQGGDSDGDGVCNNQDCQPNNPAYPATPGTPCNDGNSNTINDVVTSNGCGCAGTPVTVCDNITSGGTIGFGNNCSSTISISCNSAIPNIASCVNPAGGSGTMEIIWLKSTTSCSAPTTTAAQIIAGLDPHWVWIQGATGLTYNPGTATQNTCYLRCTRRAGCDSYVESNIISLTTDCGGGGGTPNCANITITASNGTITVGNLGAAPFASVKIFNSSWGTEYSCYANCASPTVTVNVPQGTYYVYAGYVGSNYSLICETNKTVTVTGGNPCANQGGDSDGDGVCNNQDCQPNNPAYPATPGTACNDNNTNTTNDVITADGCGCAGTPVSPCANQGGDSDGDGVCNNQDCQSNNAAYPATPGSACNDNNASTTNDVVTADGCGCAGTPVNNGCTPTTLVSYNMQACNSCSGTSSPSNWSEFTPTYSGNGGCTGLTATAISPKVAGTEHSCTPRSNGNALCTGSGNTMRFSVTLPNGGDLSGISFYEQAPAQYVWSSSSNTNCSGTNTGTNNPPTKFDLKVFKGNTQVFSQTYNTQSTWNLRNVSFGGNTSFSTTGNSTYTFEFTPHTTTGSGSVKAWDIDEIAVMGCCGSNNSGGGGTPNCANITITPGAGKVTVAGLGGAPVSSLQVFNSSWTANMYNCFGNCNATEVVTLPAGTYNVLAKYYDASWQPICEKSQTITVSSAALGDQSESLQFAAQKEEDFTALYWSHNRGNKVEEYLLERSANGSDFEQILNRGSKGGQSQELYEDFDLEPFTGDNYYRLKMVNKDGSVTYSEVQKVNFPDVVDYSLFPNPANGFVKASLESVLGAQDVNITIYNSFGIEMKQFHLDEVYSKHYQMDIRDLHEGYYIVWFNVPGHRPVAKTLMIGRI